MWGCYAYHEKLKETFQQIPTEIPKLTLECFRRKCLTLLTDFGDDWFINNMCNSKPPMNKPMLSKKKQQGEEKLKG